MKALALLATASVFIVTACAKPVDPDIDQKLDAMARNVNDIKWSDTGETRALKCKTIESVKRTLDIAKMNDKLSGAKLRKVSPESLIRLEKISEHCGFKLGTGAD
jgi:protein involved in sex pheromone biosynthesis